MIFCGEFTNRTLSPIGQANYNTGNRWHGDERRGFRLTPRRRGQLSALDICAPFSDAASVEEMLRARLIQLDMSQTTAQGQTRNY